MDNQTPADLFPAFAIAQKSCFAEINPRETNINEASAPGKHATEKTRQQQLARSNPQTSQGLCQNFSLRLCLHPECIIVGNKPRRIWFLRTYHSAEASGPKTVHGLEVSRRWDES
jgi:hypothetical protein